MIMFLLINVLKVINALSGIGHNYEFEPVRSCDIKKGDIVQYVLNCSDKSSPMYKYLMIYDVNNQNNTYEVRSMFLSAINMMGDVITEDKNDDLHDVKRLRYETWDSNEYCSKSDVNYWGAYAIHTTNEIFPNLRDLFTIYSSTDPTGLEYRISHVFSRPDTALQTGAILGISVGVTAIVVGISLLIAGIVKCCSVVASPLGVPFVLSGIALLVTGVTSLGVGITNLKSYNNSNILHKTQNSNIIKDIKKFNGNRASV